MRYMYIKMAGDCHSIRQEGSVRPPLRTAATQVSFYLLLTDTHSKTSPAQRRLRANAQGDGYCRAGASPSQDFLITTRSTVLGSQSVARPCATDKLSTTTSTSECVWMLPSATGTPAGPAGVSLKPVLSQGQRFVRHSQSSKSHVHYTHLARSWAV